MSTPPPPADRLAALEAQVAELTARLAAAQGPPPVPPLPVPSEPAYDRRSLLRRGSAALAAGVAGAVALPRSAAAAEGDPLLLGTANDAGTASTGLAGGSATAPALVLANPTVTAAGGRTAAAASLRLARSPAPDGLDLSAAQAGDLASSGDLLWYAHTSAGEAGSAATGAVYTSAFANHLAFLTEPRRVLDTRPGPATDENGSPDDRRTRVVAGSFDAAGRLRAQSALVLDLSGLVVSGVGVFANLTVVTPAAAGFLTVYPTPGGSARTDGLDRPASSNLNYGAGTSALANAVVVGLGAGGRVSIYTTTAAHVLLDLTAVSLAEPFGLTEPGGVSGAMRRW